MPLPPKSLNSFTSLVEIIKALRGPEGCPWDKEQTHESLTRYAIEEAHELAEAIESGDTEMIADELGDVLLQVVLHAEIARQAGDFEISDVIQAISEKMVRRHPHVFSEIKVNGTDQVIKNWQEIKKLEKKDVPENRFDVPPGLPALQRSSKIGHKTKQHNFDWSDVNEVLKKVDEELAEVKEAISRDNLKDIEDEIGDLLFSVSQLARHHEIDPEQALRKTNRRFEKRFFTMKKMVEDDGEELTTLTEEGLESAWQRAKAFLRRNT